MMKEKIFNDPYYDTILVKRYNPNKWAGDAFQVNAKLTELYDRINSLNPKLVIDAGCGRNAHKKHIKNLVGFDASPFPEVDYHCPILEAPFEPESADAVLCLGSVQFINRDYIIENMNKVISWVKPGGLIEMRVMVVDEQTKKFWKEYDHKTVKYPWNDDLRNEITKKHNLEYFIEPWTYQSEVNEDALKKRNRDTNEEIVRLRASQHRQCWTWRKTL